MKKIINDTGDIVNEMLRGFEMANPGVELIPKFKVIRRKQLNRDKVCLISGGGSGHEPAHAGFVGRGMLDAAVAGDVFASPSQIQVYQAIRQAAGDKGVLLIIKNYSGDMMNFKNAAYLAQEDGIQVDYVKVDDDIAVEDSLYTVGRRGVAGTVFVHKIAGAAAEQGKSLQEVKKIAEKVIANVRSIGFALTSCTTPAKGNPMFELENDRMEYGVGIHGEPGIKREPLCEASKLAVRMVDALCVELKLEAGSGEKDAAVIVNGFGGTPLMELYLLYYDVMRELAARGVKVYRAFVGNYMTSIDMAGASISVLKLDEELKVLLDEPADTPGMQVLGAVVPVGYMDAWSSAKKCELGEYKLSVETPKDCSLLGDVLTLENVIYIIDEMSACIISNETHFCEMDAHAGDGDFGMSIAKGFRQLKYEWTTIIAQKKLDIGSFLDACSMVIMEYCGGASGPIWGSAFRAAGKKAAGKHSLTVAEIAELILAAVKGIKTTGERSFGRGAEIGDKTLIDALEPCADTWLACAARGDSLLKSFHDGAAAAAEGAKETEKIVARMGRAGTIGERSQGYPDAGAYGLGVIFTHIAESLHER